MGRTGIPATVLEISRFLLVNLDDWGENCGQVSSDRCKSHGQTVHLSQWV